MKKIINSFLVGKCEEVLADFPDKSVHFVLTSPPQRFASLTVLPVLAMWQTRAQSDRPLALSTNYGFSEWIIISVLLLPFASVPVAYGERKNWKNGKELVIDLIRNYLIFTLYIFI